MATKPSTVRVPVENVNIDGPKPAPEHGDFEDARAVEVADLFSAIQKLAGEGDLEDGDDLEPDELRLVIRTLAARGQVAALSIADRDRQPGGCNYEPAP